MLKKSFAKTKPTCKVTFHLPAEADANNASLCGDFNDWDAAAHPMHKQKDGSFSITLTLETGRAYQFRYLLDDSRWENDWAADRYEPNTFGEENSIVDLTNAPDVNTP